MDRSLVFVHHADGSGIIYEETTPAYSHLPPGRVPVITFTAGELASMKTEGVTVRADAAADPQGEGLDHGA